MARNSIYYGPRATVDQMTEARALCGEDAALVAKLDYLLSKRPNDRIMQKFIDYVRDSHRDEERFAVDSSVGCRLRQGRASSAERAGTGRDNVTPILSAVVVTIVVELLALVSLHADPDITQSITFGLR